MLSLAACTYICGHSVFQSKVPNGLVNGKPTGHTGDFGWDFKNQGFAWTTTLCLDDTDGDGQSNGLELGDPCCIWTEGATPAFTTDISLPGNAGAMTSRTMPNCLPSPPPAGAVASSALPSPLPPPPPPPAAPPPSMGGQVAHGIVMTLAFGFVFPAGSCVPRFWRAALPEGAWYKVHKASMVFGSLLTAIGLILSIATLPATSKHFSGLHKLVGLVLSILAIQQPLNALLRPSLPQATGEAPSLARTAWRWYHAVTGLAIVGLGVLQLVTGVSVGSSYKADDFTFFYGLYGACLGLALLTGLLGAIRGGAMGGAMGEAATPKTLTNTKQPFGSATAAP
jgi:hypothetical protein